MGPTDWLILYSVAKLLALALAVSLADGRRD